MIGCLGSSAVFRPPRHAVTRMGIGSVWGVWVIGVVSPQQVIPRLYVVHPRINLLSVSFPSISQTTQTAQTEPVLVRVSAAWVVVSTPGSPGTQVQVPAFQREPIQEIDQ